jgi:hypothetical protein
VRSEVVGDAAQVRVFELDDPAGAGPHSKMAFGLKTANNIGMRPWRMKH